jgi:amidohydrolase
MSETKHTVIQHALQSIGNYEEVYKELHRTPELSWQEQATAAFIADQLRKINDDNEGEGFKITMGIGGTGVVGILDNGPGKKVLLRAELDALPLREETGLPYSSEKSGRDEQTGEAIPAMHACGHDMHMTSLLCAARALSGCRKLWSGMLIVLFQPSEENGAGAQAMVTDGLYDPKRFAVPIPDAVLAGHTMPMRAGVVASRIGVVNSAVLSVQATIHGRGGHGARPQNAVDPVVIMSSIVMKLQTIVSREIAPQESVVVTVGSAHAGTAENIISDKAVLKINIRALSTDGLRRAHEAVVRIIEGECSMFRCPKSPEIKEIGGFPLLENHAPLTSSVVKAFASHFKDDYRNEEYASLGAEDLSNLAVEGAQCTFWNIGCIPHDVWDQAEKENRLETVAGMLNREHKWPETPEANQCVFLPGNHSSKFAPAIQPTLRVASEALIVASLDSFGQA